MGLFIRYIRGSVSGRGIGSAGDVLSNHSPNHGGQWAGLIAVRILKEKGGVFQTEGITQT